MTVVLYWGNVSKKKDQNQFEKIFEIDNKTKWVAKNLSRDPNPTIQEEAQRIIKKEVESAYEG